MIRLSDVALRRGPRLLFEGATLEWGDRDRVGLVGDNGCGKSSLLALLTGELEADRGEVSLPAGARMAWTSQQTPGDDGGALDWVLDGDTEYRALQAKLAAADPGDGESYALLHARMEDIHGFSAPSRAARILSGLGFPEQKHHDPTRSFSGGWRVRLNLARALMCPSDILLLDEPTNHLDLNTIVWLEDWLKKYPGAVVVISHDAEFLDAVCSRIMHIENQAIRLYTGNFSGFERQRAERIANLRSQHEKQRRQIAHMENFIRRFRYKASKAKQAQSRVKALEKMQLVLPAHSGSPFRFEFKPCERLSDPILKLEDVDAGYCGPPVLHHVNLSIRAGDRIGLLGPNGAGKSTLVKVLAGRLERASGARIGAPRLRIGYFAQHQLEQLDPAATPMQQFTRLFPHAETREIRRFLGGFDFGGERVDAPIGPLSGGEKARLALALIIYDGPNLLLLDEPTNHLDMAMRHALGVALQEFQGALILVSHDRALVNRVTDRLWLIRDGRLCEFREDMAAYLDLLRRAGRQGPNDVDGGNGGNGERGAPRAGKRERRQRAAQLRQQLKPRRDEMKRLEQEMEELQRRADELAGILADPQTYETRATAEVADMIRRKSEMESRIRTREQSWLALGEELEALETSLGEG